ncbi:MAG: hypothetical protein U1F87_06495 [Kiritimatiellia bacterium]
MKAEVSNHVRGLVTGRIWLHGREEPIELELSGDAGADIAGCKVLIENPSPEVGERVGLEGRQVGKLIDCTASHRITIPLISPYEARRLRQEGKPVPCRLDNGFRLSWISPVHGEIIVEGAGFSVFTSTSGWAARKTAAAPHGAGWADSHRGDSPRTTTATQGFDEHAWERMLRNTDASNALYNKLLEKYAANPDRDRLIAREMGWPHPEELGRPGATTEGALADLPIPLPEKHKVDWIVTSQGDIAHPVADQALRLCVNIRRECRRLLVADDSRDGQLKTLSESVQNLACKLAGALNSLAYDKVVDCGFIIAYLKRALGTLNQALGALETSAENPWFPVDLAARCREELHAIREATLGLMERFRAD